MSWSIMSLFVKEIALLNDIQDMMEIRSNTVSTIWGVG